MGFASEWLRKGPVFPGLIKEAPEKKTGIIVVVPSYNEPDVSNLLNSLKECQRPACTVEVLLVVNSPHGADDNILGKNLHTVSEAKTWLENSRPFFRLYVLNIERPPIKGWGVGLARKTGMDEALRRFDFIDNTGGVIACLDADCTVGKNYLAELEKRLLEKKERKACSVYFEHPITGESVTPAIRHAIISYELHLRYYLQALIFAGYPYAFHTVGSALAVKSSSYMKAGGMNRRQAGEDFYFVQKLVDGGGYFSLNSTIVYPSPRISGRVPFGTGAAIGKIVGGRETEYLTYDLKAFSDLRSFFRMSLLFNPENKRVTKEIYSGFPRSVSSFITCDEWLLKMEEIYYNTSGPEAFIKRFFSWFNMFRIVKFLNFTHKGIFSKVPVSSAAKELVKECNLHFSGSDAEELLNFYRSVEKGKA